MEEKSIRYFACEVVQGDNCAYVPIPYGALEIISRAILANNPDTVLEIKGVGLLKL